jgi:hypothetical protein
LNGINNDASLSGLSSPPPPSLFFDDQTQMHAVLA